jgi:hypothetical protein
MNTREAAGAGVDSTKGLPLGEIRELTKPVKITEDVRKFAAEQKLSEDEALRAGMEQKAKEFVEKGAEVYAKT